MRLRPTDILPRRKADDDAQHGRRRSAPPRPHRPATPEAPVVAQVPVATQEQRVREAGGPQDRAFYTCSCGFAFDAQVSTSVACPHCGTSQAW